EGRDCSPRCWLIFFIRQVHLDIVIFADILPHQACLRQEEEKQAVCWPQPECRLHAFLSEYAIPATATLGHDIHPMDRSHSGLVHAL
ncbi:unnamed protein product, partial [Urochloa humidicola]